MSVHTEPYYSVDWLIDWDDIIGTERLNVLVIFFPLADKKHFSGRQEFSLGATFVHCYVPMFVPPSSNVKISSVRCFTHAQNPNNEQASEN